MTEVSWLRPANARATVLDAGWELLGCDPGTIASPDALPVAGWISAVVPGTVALALERAGRGRALDTERLDEQDWWYRLRFTTPKGDRCAHRLRLDGLATIADVWLDGAPVLAARNMFRRWDVALDGTSGEHELAIRFAALTPALAERRPRPAWRTRLVSHQGLRWIRTTLVGRTPGWTAVPAPVGPWRRIAVEHDTSVRVTAHDVRTRLDGRDGIADVHLSVELDGCDLEQATFVMGAGRVDAALARDDSHATVRATLRLPDVALWWPHTHGSQARYAAAVELTTSAGQVLVPLGALAFRTIHLDTTDDGFALAVNGVRVFCRGACWSPVDPVRLDGTEPEYRAALGLARDMGANMLRVGGTMTYEHDAFYEACDALGILVWQDFMFANMDYPASDPTFRKEVCAEAVQFLRRVQHRPCIAVLCGNNEIAQQAAMLGLPPERWSNAIFDEVLPETCAALRPDVPWWPSTPSGGVLPFRTDAGDAHYFGYGPYRRPITDVRMSDVRFASEALAFANVPEPTTVDALACGAAGAGHHPAWKRGVPRDPGAPWDFEDVRDHYVAEVFGTSPMELRATDPERYLALGRLASAEVMSRTFALWRTPPSRCAGGLVWLWRDSRPGAGWGLLDATGTPKSVWYALRRAFAPVAVFLTDAGLNGVQAHVVNDGALPITGLLRVALSRDDGIVADAVRPVVVAPCSTCSVDVESLLGGFADASYAYRFGPPGHTAVVATLSDAASGTPIGDAFHFPLGIPWRPDPALRIDATVDQQEDRAVLTLTATRLATGVSIDAAAYRPDDNYVHLAPGVPRRIVMRPCGSSRPPMEGVVRALNGGTTVRFGAV